MVVLLAHTEGNNPAYRRHALDERVIGVLPGTTRQLLHAERMDGVCARLVAVTVSLAPALTNLVLFARS